MNLVFNERLKHTAAWLNALATGLVAAGTFAPAAALLYGLSQPTIGGAYMVSLAAGCVAFGVGLHLTGRAMLGRLRQ
ncbi:MAG: hypothetical protein HYX37_16820 [Rhizobiales bacterium]|nr:hypothetical protein [Hyphomicrobiales bacterium]